jgi:hypothetical protein
MGLKKPAHNKMFLQWCGEVLLKVLSSFNALCRGQDAASKPHHCANTNVVGNFFWTNEKPNNSKLNPFDFWTCKWPGRHIKKPKSLLLFGRHQIKNCRTINSLRQYCTIGQLHNIFLNGQYYFKE